MTTIATGDIHLSANPRDEYRWKFVEETLPSLARERGARRVVILGDLTEQKEGHRAPLVNRLVDAVAELAKLAPVWVLKGNHDYVSEDSPFFHFLGRVPRVRWINEPTRLKLSGLGDCMFFPHTSRWSEEWAAAGLPIMKPDWYFCHQTFEGARSENGISMTGVPRSIFPSGARVISGDVHVPQRVGCVTYAGAPYAVDFGDDFAPRVLLLSEGRAPESVPVPGPQKRLVSLSGRDPLAKLAALEPGGAGDVVKVRVELPPGSELTRAEARARVRQWAESTGAELWAVEVSAPRAALGKSTDRPRKSDSDLVRQYAKKMRQGRAVVAAGLKLVDQCS